ncbi:DUF6603 domain-containing protein [Geodermatophilus sp. SYSU D00867]
MAADSVFEGITHALVDAITSALDGANVLLPPLDPPDAAAARQALAQLPQRARAVTEAADPNAWVGAVDSWRSGLRDVADAAFGGPDGPEAMLVRFLDERLPRTAAFLTVAGVIARDPDGQDTIDWVRADQVLRDPGTAVNEELWDALLGDAGAPGTGRLPAVLVGLFLLVPQTLIALARGDNRIAPLPAPPTDAPGPWRDFRERSEDWISITVPFGDPASADPHPGSIYDLAADLLPDLSATLGIRSQRVARGGGTRTLFEMWLALAATGDRWQYDFDDGWHLRVEPGINVGFGYDGSWHGAFRQFPLANVTEPPGPDDPVIVSFGRELPDDAPDLALGPPYDTRLVARDLVLYLEIRETTPVVVIGVRVEDFSLVLTNRWWRTFGVSNTVLGDGVRFDLDLGLAYVEGTGLRLNLGAGLAVTFDVDATIGPKDGPVNVTLHSIEVLVPITATASSFDIRAEVRFHVSLKLGPATLVCSGLGGWVGWWTVDGDKQYVGFLPPTGAGLQVEAGIFTGGGFLDFTGGPNERFGGVVYVKVGTFEVTAFGLHELTGSPADANRSRSFILVLGVRFSPGIQVGFGFEISGFGGLIGINRRVDTDALRERLTSGAAGNVLFAEDPIRNAPALLGDLGALFPPAEGTHVFGPTIQFSWLNLAGHKFLLLDIGLFFEFPGPTKIVLFGSARASVPPIPDVPKLLQLRLDVVGFVDFPRRIIEVDATLIQSHALFVFHLTGDGAFRLHWGDPAYLVLSLGGTHPRFEPEPAVLPEMTRLALTLDSPSPGLLVRAEAYFAVTSNTVQFGGRIEVGYKLGPLNLVGFLALDALVQFSPFWFEVSISAGVRLRWNSFTLAGVRLEGVLSGPGPFTIVGKACFEILWFDICAEARIVLGPSAEPAPAPVSSVVQELRSEVADPANLEAVGGDDREVAQQPRPTAGARPLVSPLGAVRWTQKRAPFDVLLDRFEGNPLPTQQSVILECPHASGTAVGLFAPGSFTNLSESEALNRPAFEQLDAGVVLGFATQESAAVLHPVAVVEIRLPERVPLSALAFAFARITLAAVTERTGPAVVRTTAPTVTVTDERFAVRTTGGALLAEGRPVTDAHQRARRVRGVALPADDVVDVGVF